MGSPLSPIVANLYMESLEGRALQTAPRKPKLWIRYLDDTFILWPHSDEVFHDRLNAQHPSIQFTSAREIDGRIPFLDVLVEKKNGEVSTSVYRKRTHTDRYIHYSSHHHPRILTGVIRCLKNRADNVCDSQTRASELKHLFEANGYPTRMVRRAHLINNRQTRMMQQTRRDPR